MKYNNDIGTAVTTRMLKIKGYRRGGDLADNTDLPVL